MPGRYAKAPLVYMTARIKTTPLPNLTGDQWALVEQAMIKHGLPDPVRSEIQELSLAVPAEPNQAPVPAVKAKTLPRHGFFSIDRSHSLILDQNGIEWRTSAYTRYANLCQKIEGTLNALCEAVDAYHFIPAQELSLSYVDLIAPLESRALSDYFVNGDSVLPIGLFKGTDRDRQNFGSVQVDRIVEPNTRIFVSLEELSTIKGKPSNILPPSMIEPDPRFAMPLSLRDEWSTIGSDHYALLTTQAALLTNTQLGKLKFEEACDPIHQLTQSTFDGLINRAVCDVDWEYVTDKSEE